MKRFSLLAILVAAVWAGGAQDMTGTWSGTANLGPASLRLVFHISENGGTMDSPDQGATGIPITRATFARDTLRLTIAPIDFSYVGVLKGETIEGSFTQRGARFPLDLKRGEPVALNRPQEPRPPFHYRVEEIVFENPGAGIGLAGTLTSPSEGSGFPAVVLLTGSGAQNRDEELFGHKPFLVLADHLTRRGIAVLRFDDRGVGGSGGDPATATSADFATDAAAALDYLRTRPEIDPRKTGLAGHSEGGLIAFIAAAEHPEKVAFVVSMAGPGVRGDSISVTQYGDIAAAQGAPAASIPAIMAKQRRDLALMFDNSPEYVKANIDAIAARIAPGFEALPDDVKNATRAQIRASNSPWWRFFAAHDPADDLVRVGCPVLAINGSKDLQVRASINLAAIRAGLEAGGNTALTAIEYPGLNHLFQTSATGRLDEYGQIEETISPRVLDDVADWILRISK
jgi:pimeloyl-ACP methyl ester carboxylesterase